MGTSVSIAKAKEAVSERLRSLPTSPGCYLFKDETGRILYVGKAINLRSRVRSYFRASSNLGARIARMVALIRDIEWIVVDSELVALVLECNLIKRHRPPYNVRLRDDKSYPFIVITKEPFPRVMFTRRVRNDGSRYFGPFSSAQAVRETLGLLHKVFRLIPCGKSWTGDRVQRPCLYYHMGQCLAPCAGLADREEYERELQAARQFLEGKQDALLKDLKKRMQEAAERLDFEQAARWRDAVDSIEQVLERQKVVGPKGRDQDVVALVRDDRGTAVQMFFVRGGKLIGQRMFQLDGTADRSPAEAVQEFVKQYYAEAPEVPNEVLLPIDIEEHAIIESWLRSKRGQSVRLEIPKRGDRRRLVELAATNAELALEQLRQEEAAEAQWAEEAMQQLEQVLQLPRPPWRIEGFDVSNIQGSAPVASMVVFEQGKPAKAEYRRFRIKFNPESPDDFAMMREAVLRRFRAWKEGKEKFQRLPDLLVIDGGRGQLHAALHAQHEVGLTVPTIGLAKRREQIFLPERRDPIELPLDAPGLVLIRRLRDEAHRFALSYHRKLRDKRLFGNPLDEVPGIGPKRRRLLLRTFGSLEGIRRAAVDEIAAVPTMTRRLAEKVKEVLE
ncbi:MAG: excinuclease ABC subunit UvrC [Armatimonadetes bacterium]|nr:MAG: excinuclease ABC subunit UvrC [Armatimonadota bacterium]